LKTEDVAGGARKPVGEHHHDGSRPVGAPDELDCGLKRLAVDFARSLLPERGSLETLHDALQLPTLCGDQRVPPEPAARELLEQARKSGRLVQRGSSAIVVDASNGSDDHPGTVAQPVRTLAAALALARGFPSQQRAIELRGGVHFLNKTIILTPEDSGTVISSHDSELAILSGGLPLRAKWAGVSDAELDGVFAKAKRAGVTVKKAKLQLASGEGNVPDFTEVYAHSAVVGRRLVRARYPNANPETQGIHTRDGWLPSQKSGAYPPGLLRSINSSAAAPLAWGAPKTPPNGSIYDYAYTAHARSPTTECGHERCRFNATTGHFPQFGQFKIGLSGTDGPCAHFTPPAGIWCQSHPDAGRTFEVPTSVTYSASSSGLSSGAQAWAAQTSPVVVHAFQGSGWGSWTFTARPEMSGENLTLTFTGGGNQEARGDKVGGPSYIDNALCELDEPLEWFWDVRTQTLYMAQNGSTPLPTELVAPQLETLIHALGTDTQAVKKVTVAGITLAHSQPTYLSTYEMPTGGDVSVHRGAALVLENTEDCSVTDATFSSVGGNGVLVSRKNLRARIAHCEFRWTGDGAIVVLGETDPICHDFGADHGGRVCAKIGPSALTGSHPSGTVIERNLIRELGVYNKQAAAVLQALATATTIRENVFFNMPRAGVDLIDGFGGNHTVERNFGANCVRETSDHGPVNTWDRQPFVEYSNGSMIPPWSTVKGNFFINNYNAILGVDHDDGSNHYTDAENVLMYSGQKNYIGWEKHAVGNLYIRPDLADSREVASSAEACARDGWEFACRKWNHVRDFCPPVIHSWSNRGGTYEKSSLRSAIALCHRVMSSLRSWPRSAHESDTAPICRSVTGRLRTSQWPGTSTILAFTATAMSTKKRPAMSTVPRALSPRSHSATRSWSQVSPGRVCH
jgi:hypothetical protein